jgi:hypothetical protein
MQPLSHPHSVLARAGAEGELSVERAEQSCPITGSLKGASRLEATVQVQP